MLEGFLLADNWFNWLYGGTVDTRDLKSLAPTGVRVRISLWSQWLRGGMVDTPVLGTGAERRGSSSLPEVTNGRVLKWSKEPCLESMSDEKSRGFESHPYRTLEEMIISLPSFGARISFPRYE